MGFWEQDYLLSEIWILQKKFSRSHRARHDKCLPIRIKKLILMVKYMHFSSILKNYQRKNYEIFRHIFLRISPVQKRLIF